MHGARRLGDKGLRDSVSHDASYPEPRIVYVKQQEVSCTLFGVSEDCGGE